MKKLLLPFHEPKTPLAIETHLRLNDQRLEVTYTLRGELAPINLIDQTPSSVERRHELWKDTCFEWFIGSNSTKKYWEFNASPRGAWNFYELEDYRSNLKESLLIESEDIDLSATLSNQIRDLYVFHTKISLKKLFKDQPTLLADGWIAVTSVIRSSSGETNYFSLKHPQEKPDFHNRIGFIISMKELLNV